MRTHPAPVTQGQLCMCVCVCVCELDIMEMVRTDTESRLVVAKGEAVEGGADGSLGLAEANYYI